MELSDRTLKVRYFFGLGPKKRSRIGSSLVMLKFTVLFLIGPILATPKKLRFKSPISANHWNSNGTQSDFDDHAEVFGGQY